MRGYRLNAVSKEQYIVSDVVGEIGLTGEVRLISREKIVNEASKLGFEKVLYRSVMKKLIIRTLIL